MDKASLLRWTIRGAGLLLVGTWIYCGPGSPESHLGIKTNQPMWEMNIACYDWGGNKMEQVRVSHTFSEQDIQDEANLEHLLNQVRMYVCNQMEAPYSLVEGCVLIHLPSVL